MDHTPQLETLEPLPRAARILRVPSRWLRAEAEAGRVPALLAGDRWMFDVARVAGILRERAAKRTPAADTPDHSSGTRAPGLPAPPPVPPPPGDRR